MKQNNLKNGMRSLPWIVVSSLIFVGCQQAPQNEIAGKGLLDGLYTTRPQVDQPIVTILKLQTPALLEASQRKDGKLVIDQDLVKAITAEQDATISELKKISPDIRVLIRYKLVLNGLAVWAPADVSHKLAALPQVQRAERSSRFARPQLDEIAESAGPIGEKTSVKFIGAEAAYKQGFRGKGMRVGIIDSGIDYTHKMFLGPGTQEAYKAVDPSKADPGFPNKKIVGGIDLVGSNYIAGTIPTPDENPIDESGHGTHVAGTVGGIGDGLNTHDGVAPEAELYAIKVFGGGATSDEVVIAALEYSIDPDQDLSLKNQLDVVNLSLGSGYGTAHTMYNEAIRNTVKGGTVVVASAGNSGDTKYITGAPAASDDAISVASSLDDSDFNTLFSVVEVSLDGENKLYEYVEGGTSKPLKDLEKLEGEIVAVGLADKDFSKEVSDRLNGKIALIDRGGVVFDEKLSRAQKAGAIAVIMVTNNDEAPIPMGGEGKFDIPAVMISKAAGQEIKDKLAPGAVIANLKSTQKMAKPWLADTISSFSSRGPRSDDGVIKPEISSPGSNIVSAAVGGGDIGTLQSGTSMAGPHIAGVMALLKEKFKDLSVLELKSVLMGQAKVIADDKKKPYTVSRQGAGRVQLDAAIDAKVISLPSAISLGITDIEQRKTLSHRVTLKNISKDSIALSPKWVGTDALRVSAPAVSLKAGESKEVVLKITLYASSMKTSIDELDGHLQFVQDEAVLIQMPILAVARKISQVSANDVKVFATSAADAAGSAAEVTLTNNGLNEGQALLFNLINLDNRKIDLKPDTSHSRACDLQSAGYRLIDKKGGRVLQVALKLFEGNTSWVNCEVNVQIDGDGDGETDQELAGLPLGNIQGLVESIPGLKEDMFSSVLLDGQKAKDIRKEFEAKLKTDNPIGLNFAAAVLDIKGLLTYDLSTLAVLEVDASLLKVSPTGDLRVKISTSHASASPSEEDDYLGDASRWISLSLNPEGQSFEGLPELITLEAKDSQTITLTKGYGTQDLILYAPQNRTVKDTVQTDAQSQVVPVVFADSND